MTNSVAIGALNFGAERAIDGLVFTGLTDWDGKPDARGNGANIPSGHGVYSRTKTFRLSRAISLAGAVIADSLSEYHAARRAIEALPDVATMSVDTGDGPWSREVEIKTIKVDDHRGATATRFTIDMIATDPVRYRAPTTVGPVSKPVRTGGLRFPTRFPWNFGTEDRGRADIENTGTVPLYPTLTVSGWGAAVTVHCGPRRLEFGAFNGDLVFDARQRRAFLHGADVTRQTVRREWPAIPPGETYEIWIESTGAGEMTLSGEYEIGAW